MWITGSYQTKHSRQLSHTASVRPKSVIFSNVTLLHCGSCGKLAKRCCTMFSSWMWTLNCKPVDSKIIPRSWAFFNNTSPEKIVFYIFHPKKHRIVDMGGSISSVDWGEYAHGCSSDETLFKLLIPANVIIIYLAKANMSFLQFNALKEVCMSTWVKIVHKNVIR